MGRRVRIKHADTLKMRCKQGKLTVDYIKDVLGDNYFPPIVKPVIFSGPFLSEFFDATTGDHEIKATISKALRYYLANL